MTLTLINDFAFGLAGAFIFDQFTCYQQTRTVRKLKKAAEELNREVVDPQPKKVTK